MAANSKEQSNGEGTAVSKMGAVRAALKQLGRKAQPLAIQNFVKEQYGLEMTTAHISNYKSMILHGPAGRRRGFRPQEKEAGVAVTSGRGRPPKAGKSGITIADIETVKGLVSRVGADGLKTLINLLDK